MKFIRIIGLVLAIGFAVQKSAQARCITCPNISTINLNCLGGTCYGSIPDSQGMTWIAQTTSTSQNLGTQYLISFQSVSSSTSSPGVNDVICMYRNQQGANSYILLLLKNSPCSVNQSICPGQNAISCP